MRKTIWYTLHAPLYRLSCLIFICRRIKSALCRLASSKEEDVLIIENPKTQPASTSLSLSAASTVLRTPELVEMILMHLNMQELLPLQRTSRAFRDIILASAPLKRKLFLAPASHESTNQETDNPYLKALFPTLGTYLLTGNPKWRPKFIKAITEEDMERIDELFWACETSSWRNMYLTQPPAKEMTVYAGFEQGKGGRSVEELVNAQVSMRSATGVTMGMVFDSSAKARRKARCGDVRRNDSGYASLDISEMERDDISVAVVEINV
jgi:hypothetical protein